MLRRSRAAAHHYYAAPIGWVGGHMGAAYNGKAAQHVPGGL